LLNRPDNYRAVLQRLQPYSWLLWAAIAAMAGWVLWDRLHTIDIADVVHRMVNASPYALLTAIACVLGVNILAGIYEGIAVHTITGKRTWLHPGIVASVANPIGHMVGNAVLGSGALRYRLHSAVGLNAVQIGGVIMLTAMPFLLGVGWLIDLALLMFAEEAGKALHIAVPTVIAFGMLGLMKDAGWLWFVSTRRRPLQIAGYNLRIPGLNATLLQTMIGVGEIILSAAVLYVFLPPIGVSLPTFVAIYLLATMFGQLSHVPAGLGVFEAALLVMMPQVPPAQLIGAVLLYRAVYDLLPLAAALGLLVVHETRLKHSFARHVSDAPTFSDSNGAVKSRVHN
jgi:uncharacterized membrane protein YbhN (UPF0104 family)